MTARHRFPIGTPYTRQHGKQKQVCTVIDHLTTTNIYGEVVALRYVTVHEFCGRAVYERDVSDTTIARGLLPEFQHLLDDTTRSQGEREAAGDQP